jgi:hypothetical protein
MAQNKTMKFGPIALTATLTTNILNGGAAGAGAVGITVSAPYLLLKRIRITNKDSTARTFSLYLGATGANAPGTEFIGAALSIAANSAYDWTSASGVRMELTDFLVGGASALTTLTIQGELEIGISHGT